MTTRVAGGVVVIERTHLCYVRNDDGVWERQKVANLRTLAGEVPILDADRPCEILAVVP